MTSNWFSKFVKPTPEQREWLTLAVCFCVAALASCIGRDMILAFVKAHRAFVIVYLVVCLLLLFWRRLAWSISSRLGDIDLADVWDLLCGLNISILWLPVLIVCFRRQGKRPALAHLLGLIEIRNEILSDKLTIIQDNYYSPGGIETRFFGKDCFRGWAGFRELIQFLRQNEGKKDYQLDPHEPLQLGKITLERCFDAIEVIRDNMDRYKLLDEMSLKRKLVLIDRSCRLPVGTSYRLFQGEYVEFDNCLKDIGGIEEEQAAG